MYKYLELIKEWIDSDINGKLIISDKYKEIFKEFKSFFKNEMDVLNDEQLQQEMDIMSKLINCHIHWQLTNLVFPKPILYITAALS